MDDISSQITILEQGDDQLPYKRPPLTTGRFKAWGQPDSASVAVLCAQKVIGEVQDEARKKDPHEIGGVLLGDVYSHEGITYIEIGHCILAQSRLPGQSSLTHFQFAPETWAEMLRIKDRDYDQLKVVGWLHSHPGHGVFLSGDDEALQKDHFRNPWHTALVYDPRRHEGGFFIWQDSRPVPAPGFYELFDAGSTASVVTWRNLRAPHKKPDTALALPPRRDIMKMIPWAAGLVLVAWLLYLSSMLSTLRNSTNELQSAIATTRKEMTASIGELESDTAGMATSAAADAQALQRQMANLEGETTQLGGAMATTAARIKGIVAPMVAAAGLQATQVALISTVQADLAALHATASPTPTSTAARTPGVTTGATATLASAVESTLLPSATSTATALVTLQATGTSAVPPTATPTPAQNTTTFIPPREPWGSRGTALDYARAVVGSSVSW